MSSLAAQGLDSSSWDAWRPIELELCKDGYLARVTRSRFCAAPRWRWSVTPLEIVERGPSRTVERAHARGYCKSPDRAMEMAEASIVALHKAEIEALAEDKRRRSRG
jgi:hypothetical protein